MKTVDEVCLSCGYTYGNHSGVHCLNFNKERIGTTFIKQTSYLDYITTLKNSIDIRLQEITEKLRYREIEKSKLK